MKKSMRMVVTVLLLLLVTIPVNAKKRYQEIAGEMKLTYTNGRAVLEVGENIVPLTKSMVTIDGIIDEQGTVYLVLANKSVYWYSWKYQGFDTKLNRISSSFISFEFDNGKASGYETAEGYQTFLTDAEIREYLSVEPTEMPPEEPTKVPTETPSAPSEEPTKVPTETPSTPSEEPTKVPTETPPAEPTKTPTSPSSNQIPKKVIYAYKIVPVGDTMNLYNSQGKKVKSYKLKNGVLTYMKNKRKKKNIKYVAYNATSGKITYITKKGQLWQVVTAKKDKLIGKNFLKFKYNKKGFATYAIRKRYARAKMKLK